jgi:excisionase family DNA binding protein
MQMDQTATPNFLTRQEARGLLRVSASTLDAEVRCGRLKVHRFGRLVRIDSRDLAEYIQQSRAESQWSVTVDRTRNR